METPTMATFSAPPKAIHQFLDPPALVERWNGQVKETTLSTWRSRGLGPAYVKVGGRVLYRLADVEAFEAKNTRGK